MAKLDFIAQLVNHGFNILTVGGVVTAIGARDGYAVTVSAAGYAAQARFTVSVDDFKALKPQLKGVENAAAPIAYVDKTKVLTVTLKAGGKGIYNAEGCLAALDAVIKLLRENGVRPLEVCPHCGAGSCDIFALYKGNCRAMHRSCVSRAAAEKREQAEHNEQEGSYLTGILGAILGMLVCCVPSVLTIVYGDTIYSLLYALIPLGAYYGYKLFRGRMNRAVVAVSIILTVIGVFCIQYMSLAVSLMKDYGVGAADAIAYINALFAEGELGSVFLSESVMPLIFGALGIFIVWRLITRTAADEVADVENVLDTAIEK